MDFPTLKYGIKVLKRNERSNTYESSATVAMWTPSWQ